MIVMYTFKIFIYTCILIYAYMQDNYVYMQDIYVFMQDNHVYMQDNYVYMHNYLYIITYFFHIRQNFSCNWKMYVVISLQGHRITVASSAWNSNWNQAWYNINDITKQIS